MTDAADLVGELATHRHTARRPVTFSAATLTLTHDTGWQGGECQLIGADGSTAATISCTALSALSANGAVFPVTIIYDGESHGPFIAEGIVTRFPQGADCYVFRRGDDGFWDGVAVTLVHRGIAIVPYACDPT